MGSEMCIRDRYGVLGNAHELFWISSIFLFISLKFLSSLMASSTGLLCKMTTGLITLPNGVVEVAFSPAETVGVECELISGSGDGVGCRSGSTDMAGDEQSDEEHQGSSRESMSCVLGADSCNWIAVVFKSRCSSTPEIV